MPNLGIIASSTRQGLSTDTGAMYPLQVVTVGPANAANITFTNIPSTYKHLQIRAMSRYSGAGTDDNIYMQFNADTTSGNYSNHYMYGNGTSAFAGGNATDSVLLAFRVPGASSSANIFGTGTLDILDYANTNKYKTIKSLTGHNQNGSGLIFLFSGKWNSTSAITSIKLYSTGSNLVQYSSFALYGIKGAS